MKDKLLWYLICIWISLCFILFITTTDTLFSVEQIHRQNTKFAFRGFETKKYIKQSALAWQNKQLIWQSGLRVNIWFIVAWLQHTHRPRCCRTWKGASSLLNSRFLIQKKVLIKKGSTRTDETKIYLYTGCLKK